MVCSSAVRPRSFIVRHERFFEIVECFPAPYEGHPAFLNRALDDTGRVGSGVEQVDDLVESQSGFLEFGPPSSRASANCAAAARQDTIF